MTLPSFWMIHSIPPFLAISRTEKQKLNIPVCQLGLFLKLSINIFYNSRSIAGNICYTLILVSNLIDVINHSFTLLYNVLCGFYFCHRLFSHSFKFPAHRTPP